MAQLLQPNQMIAGYEIEELVGKGGMGEVYRARQVSMHRVVALKVLTERLAKRDPSFAKRFVDEARAAGRLNNPNIIAVHDVGKTHLTGPEGAAEDLYYFSMEYVDGETIKQIIKREGACKLDLIKQVMEGMAEALVYAESMHVVHRDIKPDNIMVSSTGAVKLADLGLAQNLGVDGIDEDKDADGRKRVMGTPLYMSPEQARALPVDHRSDQYSLGATLFHMLTGHPPYIGDSSKAIMRAHVFDPIPEMKGDFTDAWRQLCTKMMAKTPNERYPNAVAMRQAIKQAIAGHAGIGISRRTRVLRTQTDHADSMLPKLIIGAGAVVAGVIVWFLLSHGGEKPVKESEPEVIPIVIEPGAQFDEIRTAIKNLPADHADAIALLEQYLADTRVINVQARKLLGDALERRRADLNHEQDQDRAKSDEQAQVAADAIAKLIANANFKQAAEVIAGLSTEQMKSASLLGVENKVQAGLDAFQKQVSDTIAKALTMTDLDRVAANVAPAELPQDVRDRFATAIQKRRDEVRSNDLMAQDRSRWRRLAQMLDAYRYSTAYSEFGAAVVREAERFGEGDKAAVLQLAKLGEFAKKGEQFLRNCIKAAPHPIALLSSVSSVSSVSAKEVTLWDMTDTDIVYRITPTSELRKEPRQYVLLPAGDMLARWIGSTAPADIKSQTSLICASYLWFWNPDEAQKRFADIDDPLAQAVTAFAKQPRIVEVSAPAKLDGDRLTVTYNFSGKNPLLLRDFAGEGASYGDKGLRWETEKSTRKDNRSESELATLAWKPALRPPFKAEATAWLTRHVQAALVGIKAGDQALRVMFDTLVRRHGDRSYPLFIIAIGTKGANFTQLQPAFTPVEVDTQDPAAFKTLIVAEVAADGKASLICNGNELVKNQQLPDGSPVTFVLQAFRWAELADITEPVSIELESLTISGNLP
jgi:hypothetical protein